MAQFMQMGGVAHKMMVQVLEAQHLCFMLNNYNKMVKDLMSNNICGQMMEVTMEELYSLILIGLLKIGPVSIIIINIKTSYKSIFLGNTCDLWEEVRSN